MTIARMLKALCAAAAIACAATPAFAETPVAEAAAAPRASLNPALYVVRDADSTLYIFGTMHIRRPGAGWGGPEAHAALAEAQEVWTEIPMGPETQAETQRLMPQYGLSPDKPLSQRLTPAQSARLAAALARLGVPAQAVEPMRPWLAGLTVSILPIMQAGYDPNAGADQQITAAANAAGKIMRSFETVEQQLGFFAGMTEAAQIEMLMDAVADLEAGNALLVQMETAWERGDLETLSRVTLDDMRANYPELFDIIMTRRNNAWVETLSRELAGSGVDFVAVGAAHLPGPEGLVAQLQARGFAVTRVAAR
ncbi:MAG: TraB/GumN family protein [Hyphomonadaceae bacterium]|nr:TraB/GumN family protein [Hyphomonadaceae bacterium]